MSEFCPTFRRLARRDRPMFLRFVYPRAYRFFDYSPLRLFAKSVRNLLCVAPRFDGEKKQHGWPWSSEHGTHQTATARFWPWLNRVFLGFLVTVLQSVEDVASSLGGGLR